MTGASAVEVVGAVLGLSAQEQEELWRRWRRGESLRLIARQSWRARLAWVVVIDEPHPRPSALEPL